MTAAIHAAIFVRAGLTDAQAAQVEKDLAAQISPKPEKGPDGQSGPLAFGRLHLSEHETVMIQSNWDNSVRLPMAAFDWHTKAVHDPSGTDLMFGALKTDDLPKWLPPAQARKVAEIYAAK